MSHRPHGIVIGTQRPLTRQIAAWYDQKLERKMK
jgi:hypothetical protein